MRKEASILEMFHTLMVIASVITLAMVWAEANNWWMDDERWINLALKPVAVFQPLVIVLIWSVVTRLIRVAGRPNGRPCWGHEAVAHETVGVIVTIEDYGDNVWLIQWQPQKVDRVYLDCEPEGDRQLFYCEHYKSATMPKPGDRVIALRDANGLKLEPHPQPRQAVAHVADHSSKLRSAVAG